MSQLPENWTDKELMEDSTIVLYPEADYVNRLERAVHVLVNSNSDWEMNVSVWDIKSILSVLDDMSMAEMRIREERDATEYLSAKEPDWEDMSYDERRLMVQQAIGLKVESDSRLSYLKVQYHPFKL